MTTIDLDTFLSIWDSTNEETVVYLPLAEIKADVKGKAIFVEVFSQNEDGDANHLVARAFLHLEEAELYAKAKKSQGITLVKLRLDKLYNSFERYFGKKTYSKTFQCVLSSLGAKGEFVELDILWTNKLDT